ncbi:MAG: methylated-DNA--[protein]-cysteine S-methyltransferase [Anaerolineales bacterium]
MEKDVESSEPYQRIEAAIQYIEANAQRQPSLEETAAFVGLSEYHFQRLFTQWAGVSPKRFLQFLTKENAKRWLAQSENLLDVTHKVGLSSLGRLHELFIHAEAVTPGEYKAKGAGVEIRYGLHATPFGECLLAVTPRGICHLSFVEESEARAIDQLAAEWSAAQLMEDKNRTAPLAEQIFRLDARAPRLALHLRGTNFQIKVWEALLNIPSGAVTTYGRIAANIGAPQAMRAVGSAVGDNPIAYLIPCHRVIRKSGEFGEYRYGAARKKAMLIREFAST